MADRCLQNNASMIIGSKINKHNSVVIRCDISEGFPFTKINLEKSKEHVETIYDIDKGWNTYQDKPRVKLSVRYDLQLFLKRSNLTAYFEIQNVFNQQDVLHEWYIALGKNKGYIIKRLSTGIIPIGGLTIDF